MSDNLKPHDVASVSTDAQAFGLTASFNRRAFIQNLVNDPRTVAISTDVVRWLLDALEQETAAKDRAKEKLLHQNDAVAQLKAQRDELGEYLEALRGATANNTNSAAIIALASLIARQKEAIESIRGICEQWDSEGEPPFYDCHDWAKDFADVVSGGIDGD